MRQEKHSQKRGGFKKKSHRYLRLTHYLERGRWTSRRTALTQREALRDVSSSKREERDRSRNTSTDRRFTRR